LLHFDAAAASTNQELCLASHFVMTIADSLPNIDVNLLNGIVPVANPIPLW
jgi:hypothetical protein